MLNDIENLKKCPISLVKREMQMKTTEIPPYKDKLKGQHVLVGCGPRRALLHCWWEAFKEGKEHLTETSCPSCHFHGFYCSFLLP